MTAVSILTTINKLSDFKFSYMRSISSQTFKGTFEIVIVADTFEEIHLLEIKRFSSQLKEELKVDVIFLKSHIVDRGASLNLAIASARSNVLAIHDLDDFWLPTKIENQLRALNGRNIAILATESINLRNCTYLSLLRYRIPLSNYKVQSIRELGPKSFLFTNPLAHSSILFRSDLGLSYREMIISQYDYHFYIDAILANHNISVVNQPLTLIAHHANNSFMNSSKLLYKLRFLRGLVSYWYRLMLFLIF